MTSTLGPVTSADNDRGTTRAARMAPIRRLRRVEPLAVTAWALMANTVVTSALGVVFWGVASRLYSPSQVGEDAALISAMILLSTISQLNLSMGIPRLLPQVRDRRWRPVLGAYALTAGAAVLVTGCFLILAPRLSGGYAFLGRDPSLGLALLGAVVLWNIFALQDAVLTSARWTAVIPFENAVFGLLKVGLMVSLAGSFSGHGMFVAWLLAMALLLLPVNSLVFGGVLRSDRGRADEALATVLPLRDRPRIARYLATDYAAALMSQGSTALLPVLVMGVLGGTSNAYFYVAFLIAAAVRALAQNLSTSLIVEGAHDESHLASLARRSAARYLKLIAPGVVLLIVGAPLVLIPFGPAYVDNATTVLRLLLAGTLTEAVVTLYIGVERVRARPVRVLAVEAATFVLVTTGAILGMRWYGLPGIGLAWLVAQTGMAGLVMPRLWSVLHPVRSEPEGEQVTTDAHRAGSRTGRQPRRPAAPLSSTSVIDLAAALVTVALLLLAGLGVTGTPRLVLALVFVTFVPGWAVLAHLPLAQGTSQVALAVGLSLALATMASLSSLWLDLWQPRALLDVVGGLCLIALASHLRQGARPSAPVSLQ